MAASRDRSSPHVVPIRESRSLHDLFSGFFFNHVDHSRTTIISSTTGDQKSTPFQGGGGGQPGHEGVSSDSNAVALVFGAKSSDVDEFKLIDSMAEVTCAVKSSRMRRSDTWDDSLLRKPSDDPSFQPETLPPPPSGPSGSIPSVQSTSGIISFTASGIGETGTGTGTGLRGLLADIMFRPDGGTGSRGTSAGSSGPASPAAASSARHSASTTLTLEPVGPPSATAAAAAADDISLLPTSPKHRSMMRRQFTLPAVLEGEPGGSEVGVRKFESQAVEKRPPKLDVNNNDIVPDKTSSLQGNNAPPSSSPYGGQARVSAADLASPEAMRVPEAKPPPPVSPRKFGILELFAAGERKNVRNRDMNAMAPQSW